MKTTGEARKQFQELLGNVSRAGVYHLPHQSHLPAGGQADVVVAAEDLAYAVFHVDLNQATDKEALLAAIGRDMAFPEWFGNNWDALADSLGDLGWRPAEGYLVLLEHCDLLHANANSDLVAALQIFETAAHEWRERGIAFWCLVDMHADGIAWLPGL